MNAACPVGAAGPAAVDAGGRSERDALPFEGMWSQRAVVDYGLQRRATLEALFTGGASATDVCDADPYLLRAARFHGEATARRCPVCRREDLVELSYTFGDELGQYSGRIKSPRSCSGWRTSTESSGCTSWRSARTASGTT